MDLLGIKTYALHQWATWRQWLSKERGMYTNRDFVVDYMQIIIAALLIIMVLSKW